jgi:hypothetical protein
VTVNSLEIVDPRNSITGKLIISIPKIEISNPSPARFLNDAANDATATIPPRIIRSKPSVLAVMAMFWYEGLLTTANICGQKGCTRATSEAPPIYGNRIEISRRIDATIPITLAAVFKRIPGNKS